MTGGLPLSSESSAEMWMKLSKGKNAIIIVVSRKAQGGRTRYKIMSYFMEAWKPWWPIL